VDAENVFKRTPDVFLRLQYRYQITATICECFTAPPTSRLRTSAIPWPLASLALHSDRDLSQFDTTYDKFPILTALSLKICIYSPKAVCFSCSHELCKQIDHTQATSISFTIPLFS